MPRTHDDPELPPADFLALPARPGKPRSRGVTHVIDRGVPTSTLHSLLEVAGAHIDFLKFGWGTAYVSRNIKNKVVACREAKVRTCVGGTLLELAAAQGKVPAFLRWVTAVGFDSVEVSEGTVELGRELRLGLISALAADFCVLAEVGSKDPDAPVRAKTWVAQMLADLEAGASFVVAEGRESGTVGLYGSDGSVREPLVQALVAGVPAERIIFEAPGRAHQKWFVKHLGIDVNLGNIAPEDVIGIETLRRGLRADTAGLAITALGILGASRDAGGTC